MAESTAFVFCVDISGTQSAVRRSYQDVVRSESSGSRLVDEVLCICIIADCLDLLGCHIWVLDFHRWLVYAIGRRYYSKGVFAGRKRVGTRTFPTRRLMSTAKMLYISKGRLIELQPRYRRAGLPGNHAEHIKSMNWRHRITMTAERSILARLM